LTIRRALGTPLDWPEARKNAQQVREWGVQVRILAYEGGVELCD